MAMSLVFTCFTLLAATHLLNAQRPPGGRVRPNGLPRPVQVEGDRFNWTRELVNGNSAEEAAFVPTGGNIVVIRSFSENLTSANLSRASTLYDFTQPEALVAIGSFGPCFLTRTNLTYQQMMDELTARNGSTIGTSNDVYLDGTSDILPLNQVIPLFETNPALRRACRDGRVVPTVTEGEGTSTYTGPTETLSVLALDAQINIKIRARPPRTFNQGRPGRRPGFGPRPSNNEVDTLNTTATPSPGSSQ